MELTREQKILFIGLIAAIMLAVNMFVIFKPKFDNMNSKMKEYSKQAAYLKELETNAGKKQDEIDKKKVFKYSLASLNEQLPNYLKPETFVKNIKDIIVQSGIEAQVLAFTAPTEFNPADVQPGYTPENLSAANNYVSKKLFNISDAEEKAKATEYDKIKDDKAVKIDAKFNVTGKYDQIKNLIYAFEQFTNKTTVDAITLTVGKNTKDNSEEIGGNISLGLYGFKDTSVPIYGNWEYQTERGKGNLFSTVGVERYNINDSNMSDFDIALNPSTYDAPSIIMTKHGDYGTTKYGETSGTGEIELYVTERNGNFYYRYKVQRESYPENYRNVVGFVPVTNSDIIVRVFSQLRESEKDKSGIHLTVYNQTGGKRNVFVQVLNDDPERPRVSYEVK